uniref:Uncharacterized protein n=1 Tax=Pararge aegeria TaxID=116150 RepID=S4NYP9_9NEOP
MHRQQFTQSSSLVAITRTVHFGPPLDAYSLSISLYHLHIIINYIIGNTVHLSISSNLYHLSSLHKGLHPTSFWSFEPDITLAY